MQYDETNDGPYVCFRRREAKAVRKTRRTDVTTIDRLVRLKSDLASAQELLGRVFDREQWKRDFVATEIAVFDERCKVRGMKRKLGENDGDEMILVTRKEKKRKRDSLPLLSASG